MGYKSSKENAGKVQDVKDKKYSHFKKLFGFGKNDGQEKEEEDKNKKNKGPNLDKKKVSGFKKGFFGK